MVHIGKYRGYDWLATGAQIESLGDLMRQYHPGSFLCVTAFDGGPLRLDDDEISRGWRAQGDVMISPPLNESIDLPQDQYDEWYIFPLAAFPEPAPEIFVNYGGFTLVSSEDLYKTFDPACEKPDWLT